MNLSNRMVLLAVACMSAFLPTARADTAYSMSPTQMVAMVQWQFATEFRALTSLNNPGAFFVTVTYDSNVLSVVDVAGMEGSCFAGNVFSNPNSYSSGVTRIAGFQTEGTNYYVDDSLFRIIWKAIGTNGAMADISCTVSTTVDFRWWPNTVMAPEAAWATVTVDSQDSDADGIPDWWMWQHFGHWDAQTNDFSRASDDPDADGFSNRDEFVAGTDPRSALALPSFHCIDSGDGRAILSFEASPARMYGIQSTTNLGGGVWTNRYDAIPGAGTTIFLPDATDEPQKYYRLRVRLP